MGEVRRARDTRLDRDVAVKILPAEFAAGAKLKIRFEREAKTILRIEHPHICRLYDVGADYMVMELLEGPLPQREVLRFGREIAEARRKSCSKKRSAGST